MLASVIAGAPDGTLLCCATSVLPLAFALQEDGYGELSDKCRNRVF